MKQVQPHTREETVLAEKGVQLWEMESAYTQNSIQTGRGQPISMFMKAWSTVLVIEFL